MSVLWLAIRIVFALISIVRELEKQGVIKKDAVGEVEKEFKGIRAKLGAKFEKVKETSP